MDKEKKWILVNDKINEPCYFYNQPGGCKNKDGTQKSAEDCKYLHIFVKNIKRPLHLNIKKPCQKYYLDGYCNEVNCRYSHESISNNEWNFYFPKINQQLKKNIELRINYEHKYEELEKKMEIFEYKQNLIIKDINLINNFLKNLKKF